MADPDGGVVLQGSVQAGLETPESDIDLTVVIGDDDEPRFNEFINGENSMAMIRVVEPRFDVNVDIHWRPHASFHHQLTEHGAEDWFIFSFGEILHDPLGLATSCQEMGRAFFDKNVNFATAWREQIEEVRRHKADSTHVLEYPRWPDFSRRLAGLDKVWPS
jgi:hypothetical protein